MSEAQKDTSTAPAQANTQAAPAQDASATTTAQTTSDGTSAPATAAAPAVSEAPKADAAAQPPAKETPAAAAPVVPETYDLKAPEGSPLDASHIENLSAFAKEKGLSQEVAQALLERESAAASSFVQRQQDEFKNQTQAWVEELKADKTIGGAEFEKSAKLVDRMLDTHFPPDFVAALRKAGLGAAHGLPAGMFRGLIAIAKATGDDSLVREGGGQTVPMNSEDQQLRTLYPSHFKEAK